MGSESTKALGAVGRNDVFRFDPLDLTIVSDSAHPLHDPDRIASGPDERMILNVMRYGVKTPISIRLNGKDKKGKPIVEVVTGRQRVMAAREANKRLKKEGGEPLLVPAVRERGTDADMMAVMILENEIRKDDAPLSKARKLKRFLDLGRSEDDAAIVFGVTKKTIKDWLELLELDGSVQDVIESGGAPAYVARNLKDLPRAEQKAALDKMQKAGTVKGASGKQAAQAAAGRVARDPNTLPTRPQLKHLVLELEAVLKGFNSIMDGNEEDEIEKQQVTGALSMLRFVIEGKAPIKVISVAWRLATK